MNAPAPAPAAPPISAARFLDANLEALGLGAQAVERVREGRGPAVFSTRPDGSPLLAWDGRSLDGGPPPALGPPQAGEVRVVFGLGVGKAVDALAGDDVPVLVYEPSAAIARGFLARGPVALGRASLATSIEELREHWGRVGAFATTVTLLRTGGYAEAFPDELARLDHELRELLVRSLTNKNTHRVRGRDWAENLLANAPRLTEAGSVARLEGRLAGVPAFIVGAGPSLSRNVAALRDAARHGVLIAVNSALPVLARHGVQPQFVACMESADVSSVLRSTAIPDHAIRVVTLTAHPANVASGAGPLLLTWEQLPDIDRAVGDLTGASGLPACASVSTLAVSLAERLGCDPVVLVGQDLAYTGGHVYAAESPFADSRASVDGERGEIRLEWSEPLRALRDPVRGAHRAEPLQLVPGWGTGAPVPTGPSFAGARSWFEAVAQWMERAHPERRLVNATEGGARVVGWEERPLAELVAELAARGARAPDPAELAGDTPAVTAERLQAWGRGLARGARRFARAASGLERCARRALQAAERGEDAAMGARLARLERAEALLRRESEASPILGAWAYADVERFTQPSEPPGADARGQALRALEREVELARILRRAAEELERRVESRLLTPNDPRRSETCP
ncbi:MAG: DUF115 domain-containing protein [Polyangiaceae bacterium]|nr:DUF115 domain-containing protein [Polyangiaceae bacterium]